MKKTNKQNQLQQQQQQQSARERVFSNEQRNIVFYFIDSVLINYNE